MSTHATPRSRDNRALYAQGFQAPFAQAQCRPFIKLLNWYTGIGKTYNAARFSLELWVQHGVIPVFIAPLQSLVGQFASEVHSQLRARDDSGYEAALEALMAQRGWQVPLYRLYSDDALKNDRSFYAACLALVAWLQAQPDTVQHVEHAVKGEALQPTLQALHKNASYCAQAPFLQMSRSDDLYDAAVEAYGDKAAKVLADAKKITWKLARCAVQRQGQGHKAPAFWQAQPVVQMVQWLYPLQAFLERPGIILSTASKARVQQKVWMPDKERGARTVQWADLPTFLYALNEESSGLGQRISGQLDGVRAVTFVDEEEDAYWYLFESRKSQVNAGGRNELNLVISEFFQFFDLHWPSGFVQLLRDGPRTELARKVYEHLEDFAAISSAVERAWTQEKAHTGVQLLRPARKLELYRQVLQAHDEKLSARLSDAELLQVLQQLHERSDAHADFARFRQKARVLQRVRHYVQQQLWQPGVDARIQPFDVFEAFRTLVVNKKFFIMDRASYGEVLDQPGQTFFTQQAAVMDTGFLRKVQLQPDIGGQAIRLVYCEAGVAQGHYTLYDYLRLVVLIAQVLAVREGEHTITLNEVERKRYPELYRFRGSVRELFDGAISAEALDMEVSGEELLSDAFLFEELKSVVSLEESSYQAEEYNKAVDICLTLSISALRGTPEMDVVQALGRSNGVFLMSATGGLASAATGAFNVRRLHHCLEKSNGMFFPMTDSELALVQAIGHAQQQWRTRTVTLVREEACAKDMPVSPAYAPLLNAVHMACTQTDRKYELYNAHKQHELQALVACLDLLICSPMRAGFALCQTPKNLQAALQVLAQTPTGLVQKKVDDNEHYFVVTPRAWPGYRSHGTAREEVHVVIYQAEPFRKKERAQVGLAQELDDAGQFNALLEAALNVSRHKLLLCSAYQSASRGINFITTYRGQERDFELFALLNDPFYTRHTRPKARSFSMEQLQSVAQVLRTDPRWGTWSKADLLYQRARRSGQLLRREHYIDLARTIFQALGRGERRPHVAMPRQQLYVSERVAQVLHVGVACEPALRARASPAQAALLQAMDAHHQKNAWFSSAVERAQHHARSLDAARAFRQFTSETPQHFRSDAAARTLWSQLFRTDMFTHPLAYLAHVRACGAPEAFAAGCFAEVPARTPLYRLRYRLGDHSEVVLTDALGVQASAEAAGGQMDALGIDLYDWCSEIAAGSLLGALSDPVRALLRHRQGVWKEGGETRLVPQPWFVVEIMKGWVAELEFEQWVGAELGVRAGLNLPANGVRFVSPQELGEAAQLYQLFDYYLQPEAGVLVAVDIKNWSRVSDQLATEGDLRGKAEDKHAKLSELLPQYRVHVLYVNLHGGHKYPVVEPANGSIRFYSMYVNAGGQWMRNTQLTRALQGDLP